MTLFFSHVVGMQHLSSPALGVQSDCRNEWKRFHLNGWNEPCPNLHKETSKQMGAKLSLNPRHSPTTRGSANTRAGSCPLWAQSSSWGLAEGNPWWRKAGWAGSLGAGSPWSTGGISPLLHSRSPSNPVIFTEHLQPSDAGR